MTKNQARKTESFSLIDFHMTPLEMKEILLGLKIRLENPSTLIDFHKAPLEMKVLLGLKIRIDNPRGPIGKEGWIRTKNPDQAISQTG